MRLGWINKEINTATIYHIRQQQKICMICVLIDIIKRTQDCPDQCGSVGWALSYKEKGCRFDSWSRHMPERWVRSPIGVRTRCNRSMFFLILTFLSLSHSLPISLKINKTLKRKKRNPQLKIRRLSASPASVTKRQQKSLHLYRFQVPCL